MMSEATKGVMREFEEYAYSVSHDLGAPVRAMVEFSSLLKNEYKPADEDSRVYLSMIIENGRKLQEMMAGLLQYSRINTQAMPLEKVDSGLLHEACCAAMRKQLDSAGAEVTADILPEIWADPEQMMQLFCQLIDNALKYQPEGNVPRIEVSAQKDGDYWRFCVADNGIGIGLQHCERVFRLFQRLHTDEEYSGVGVGLTLAKKIIQRHHGKIWVEPVMQGVNVYFTLRDASTPLDHKNF